MSADDQARAGTNVLPRPAIKWTAGSLPARKLAWALGVIFIGSYIVVLSRLSSSPFQDAPNHLARAVAMADLMFHHGARFGSTFQYHFLAVPYVVGDLIDIWSLRRGIYWPQQHNDVIQKILRKARKGTHVVYIPGNHDELVTDFCGAYGNIEIKQRAIHVTASGERILIIHGHELDVVVSGSGRMKWLAFAGDLGYQFLLSLNPLINFVRRRFGLGYWSLSAYAKQRVKDAVSFIGKFEAAVAHYADRYDVDAVLCGHIHSAAIREFGKVTYYNCGDWVESCTALVEGDDGILSMLNYLPLSASTQRKVAVAPSGLNDETQMTNVELMSNLE